MHYSNMRTENHRLQVDEGRAQQTRQVNEIATRVSGITRSSRNRASGSLDLAPRDSGAGPIYVHDLFPAKRGH